MRPILAGILASLMFFALAGAASANDGGTGNLQDPDLIALKQAVDDFRTKLATLADSCALSKDAADATVAKTCKEQYAALRAEFKTLKQAALVLVRNQHQWAERAKQEADQLKKETDKSETAKHDESALDSKTAADKLKWIDDRQLQDKVDLDAAKQHAQDARDVAAGLSGEKQDEALAVASKWDEKAAQYAEDIKRLTALRAQVVASQQPKAEKPKTACASNTTSCQPKTVCASNTTSCQPKTVCASTTTSCQTSRDKLTQQLKSLDDTIAYKKAKLADLQDLLAYKLAQAEATTGEEHDRWLELAQGVREEIAQWTGYLSDLLKQREELVKKLNAAPTTSAVRDELNKQLKSLDDLIAYKLQKVAAAKDAGDEDAVRTWTNLLNDVLAQRAAVVAKLNALPK